MKMRSVFLLVRAFFFLSVLCLSFSLSFFASFAHFSLSFSWVSMKIPKWMRTHRNHERFTTNKRNYKTIFYWKSKSENRREAPRVREETEDGGWDVVYRSTSLLTNQVTWVKLLDFANNGCTSHFDLICECTDDMNEREREKDRDWTSKNPFSVFETERPRAVKVNILSPALTRSILEFRNRDRATVVCNRIFRDEKLHKK